MGFYIRKSVSVGPLRFNLSKGGIGVSAGIKGFRVGTGPRGNYVHMGRGGIYFRQSLPVDTRRQTKVPLSPPLPRTPQADSTVEPFQEIESSSVLQMVDSSSADLLGELNSKRKKIRLLPISVALLIVL